MNVVVEVEFKANRKKPLGDLVRRVAAQFERSGNNRQSSQRSATVGRPAKHVRGRVRNQETSAPGALRVQRCFAAGRLSTRPEPLRLPPRATRV